MVRVRWCELDARYRLYDCIEAKFVRDSMRWRALAEIYTMHYFALFSNRIPKTRNTMRRKELGPYNPAKTWPGEAPLHRSRGIRL